MPNIKDVAARAGVSVATVSRVMNSRPVRADLEAAVRVAAEELDFRPNRAAQELRRRISSVIALIVPDIENPFFTSIAKGAAEVASESGFSLTLWNSDNDPASERAYLDLAARDRVAGVLLASCDPDAMTGRGRLIVVAVDRDLPEAVDRVVLPNQDIAASITHEVVASGRRRIAFIGGPERVSTATERLEGWRNELRAANLPVLPGFVIHTDFQVEGARAAVARLLRLHEPPDGIVAANNLAGVGALRALSDAGVPESRVKVAVIGDLPFATASHPDVAVAQLPTRELGRHAAELLVERSRGDQRPGRRVILAASYSRLNPGVHLAPSEA